MKPYHTKNLKSILKAIKEDKYPTSLLALELRHITPTMATVESMRISRLLIELSTNN